MPKAVDKALVCISFGWFFFGGIYTKFFLVFVYDVFVLNYGSFKKSTSFGSAGHITKPKSHANLNHELGQGRPQSPPATSRPWQEDPTASQSQTLSVLPAATIVSWWHRNNPRTEKQQQQQQRRCNILLKSVNNNDCDDTLGKSLQIKNMFFFAFFTEMDFYGRSNAEEEAKGRECCFIQISKFFSIWI